MTVTEKVGNSEWPTAIWFDTKQDTPIGFAAGIAIVVGSFISGGTATPNFTRFAKTPGVAVVATVVAFFAGNSVMMIFGAVGGAVTGVADIFNILILQGLAVPAIVTLGLNIWTTNNNALYTAGLGFCGIFKFAQQDDSAGRSRDHPALFSSPGLLP